MSTGEVIASGNLATPQRTVMGVLGQFDLMEVPAAACGNIVTQAGLPARALETPDFPISLQQELAVALGIVRWMGQERSSVTRHFLQWRELGIQHLGVLGMAMQHAPTALEALKVCFNYPQLIWGHSRMVVSRSGEHTLFSFFMDRPQLPDASAAEVERLLQHLLAQDAVSTARNTEDIQGRGDVPAYMEFAFEEPPDWNLVRDALPCPVRFSAAETRLAYPATIDDMHLPRSNELIFRNYLAIAERLSQTLADNIGLSERVTRLLWAYSPPLNRREVAAQLAMSERNLTRKLNREGHSFAGLLASVQEERAKNFLRSPSLSVTEIGERLGYSEPAAFSRAFSGWTGLSPLQWRKRGPGQVG